jgi:hypothetical protein
VSYDNDKIIRDIIGGHVKREPTTATEVLMAEKTMSFLNAIDDKFAHLERKIEHLEMEIRRLREG